MKLLFWISVGAVAYTLVLYPLILIALSAMRQLLGDLRYAFGRIDRRENCRWSEGAPRVSLIVAAHNEEAVILSKMLNCASLDYPAGRLEVLIGCDGCTDRTAAVARSAALPNAQVLEFERSGKPATLNTLVQHATGDVLVFSDANTMYRPDAIGALLRHFGNERVGAVCGELRLSSAGEEAASEGLYWRYECFLKFLESRLNMLVGANGAIFAVRRNLFTPLPPRTINDDFITAMRVRAGGFRVVYDPGAVGCEEAAGTVRQEFQRRIRIGRGNLRSLKHTWRLLLPQAGLIAVSYWSHKVFRWLVPFACLSALAASVALAREPFYAVCAALAAAFGGLAALGLRSSPRASHPLVRIPCYFVLINAGLLVGIVKDLFGGGETTWTPTARTGAAEDGGERPAGAAAGAGRSGVPVSGTRS